MNERTYLRLVGMSKQAAEKETPAPKVGPTKENAELKAAPVPLTTRHPLAPPTPMQIIEAQKAKDDAARNRTIGYTAGGALGGGALAALIARLAGGSGTAQVLSGLGGAAAGGAGGFYASKTAAAAPEVGPTKENAELKAAPVPLTTRHPLAPPTPMQIIEEQAKKDKAESNRTLGYTAGGAVGGGALAALIARLAGGSGKAQVLSGLGGAVAGGVAGNQYASHTKA